MAPIGSRDGSQTVTPLVAGYIARQLQRGVYKDMPFITPLTGPQLATVRQLAGDLLAVEAGVQRLVERKPRRPQPSMESTIKSVMNRYSAGLETVLVGSIVRAGIDGHRRACRSTTCVPRLHPYKPSRTKFLLQARHSRRLATRTQRPSPRRSGSSTSSFAGQTLSSVSSAMARRAALE